METSTRHWKPQKRWQKKRAAVLATYIDEYKTTHGCACGQKHPACLDFHHRDPSTKLFGISRAVTNTVSLKRIVAEIDKCDLLCKNCHAKVHWAEDGNNGP